MSARHTRQSTKSGIEDMELPENVDNNGLVAVIQNMLAAVTKELKEEIHDFKGNMDARLTTLEDRMSAKVQEVQDTIRAEVTDVRQHMDTEVARLDNRLDSIVGSIDNVQERAKNFVVKYLPQDNDEVVGDKVSGLMEAIGVTDVVAEKVVRKPAVQEGTAGVVIVTCRSKEDKDKVLKCKAKLKDCGAYSNVYIENDKPRRERQYEANLRLLVNTIGRESLMLKGDRLCKRTAQQVTATQPGQTGSRGGQTGRGRGRGRGTHARGGRAGQHGQATHNNAGHNTASTSRL